MGSSAKSHHNVANYNSISNFSRLKISSTDNMTAITVIIEKRSKLPPSWNRFRGPREKLGENIMPTPLSNKEHIPNWEHHLAFFILHLRLASFYVHHTNSPDADPAILSGNSESRESLSADEIAAQIRWRPPHTWRYSLPTLVRRFLQSDDVASVSVPFNSTPFILRVLLVVEMSL